MNDAEAVLEATVREEWGRLVALLLARYRRLDLVEDALAEAVEAASRRWPRWGAPDRPAAWLLTTARRRILDRFRAEAMHRRREPLLVVEAVDRRADAAMADPGGLVEDDVLRLVLMCTHPALDPTAASALALRLVLGVSTHDIARLFLVSEPAMAARITRAKKRIVAAGIPFAVPDASVLPERIDSVAHTAYLAFTAGYAPGSGPPVRVGLAGEAIRLTRVVLARLPGDPGLEALLALMLLQHARRDARVGPDGELVLLADQDRSRWHRDEIAEGLDLLARSTGADGPSPADAVGGPGRRPSGRAASYAVQAQIAAEHAIAGTAEETRWDRIAAYYDLLVLLDPNPSARLARAVAQAEAHGPAAGLAALEGVEIPGSHRVAAVRAELLSRVGDLEGARAAYDEALRRCHNDAERRHLLARREALPRE